MKRRPLLISLAFCMITSSSFGQNKQDLVNAIRDLFDIPAAQFGLAFKNLQNGDTLFLNEKQLFHAASTMKTPVLAEIYKQSVQGLFSLSDSIPVKNQFYSIVDRSEYSLQASDDSEQGFYKRIGGKATIAELANAMITRSSNLATNLLIELVKPENIMNTLHSIGIHDMKVLRGVEDGKAFEKGLNNSTTALDLMLLFDALAREQLVDRSSSKEMINILLNQEFREIIPALLPPDARVAHKTGSITGIQHDSGIVFLPGGKKYVIVFLSRFDSKDEKKVVAAMAEVSKLVYNYVSSQ